MFAVEGAVPQSIPPASPLLPPFLTLKKEATTGAVLAHFIAKRISFFTSLDS